MDMFKSAPVAATPPANTPPAGKEDLSANPPSTDANGKMPGTAPLDVNPLDAYSKMFDNANKDSELQAPNFKIDPKTLNEVSGKMDFTRGVDPAVLQKATSGDVNALLDIIKTVGQNSYKAALEHNTALTDTFITQRGEFEKQSLERGVKTQLTSSALADTPNYSHPVVKAELNRIAAQFSAANPDSSPQEIAKAAQKYINDLQAALNPKDPSKNTDGTAKEAEMDWSKYLTNS